MPRRRRPTAALAAAALAVAAPAGAAAPTPPPAPAPASAAAAPSVAAAAASSAAPAVAPPQLRLDRALAPPPRGDAARGRPAIVQARELSGRPDLETIAEGDAEFRRAGTLIRADSLRYDQSSDTARARGNVHIERDGNSYDGTQLELQVERFEGFFLEPTYFFSRMQAGGSAQRIDFLGEQRAVASAATYTSCTPDGRGSPAWLLKADRVQINLEGNEGVAEGAVLRFLGVPILAAPKFSFPLTDDRKSGWLPPSIGLDSRSGLQLSIPWYWNIAPNRDLTLVPAFSLRRGPALSTEFRYLEPRYSGQIRYDLLPNDLVTGDRRYAVVGKHEAELRGDTTFGVRVLRVSDDAYWKDFPREVPSLTPRLLLSDVQVSRPFGGWTTYARALSWQVLQSADTLIETPYERLPQIGARTLRHWGGGIDAAAEVEFNRFANPSGTTDPRRLTADRTHLLASISRPWVTPGWSLVPKLAVNAANYSFDQPLADGRTGYTRTIPTVSVDSTWVLERDADWFGRALRQTLEPRLLYANTPYRSQPDAVNFDSAVKEFNFDSIFSENAFSGVDRVSDAHQLTAGVTTRLLDPVSGAEAMRLGVAQRYLFRDQLITPDGQRLTQHLSDLLLLGSTTLIPRWTLDAALQYNTDTDRVARTLLGARYSPGAFRTINATYRLTRGLSRQLEIGWQWPFAGRRPPAADAVAADGAVPPRPVRQSSDGTCGGTWYTVGRVNYSLKDSRINDSIFGIEYDAGCWIGRLVGERLSTGRSEATTRLLFQLELVGLSRLGSNPLQVLKDNIPGYRLLRDGRNDAIADPAASMSTTTFP